MEFPDIDPSQFLDQMNWESQDNADSDNDNRRASNGDTASEDISCDLGNSKQDTGEERENWRWESVLFGLEDQRDEGTAMEESNGAIDGDNDSMNNGGSTDGARDLSAATQQQGYASIYSFPPMASYESMMLSNTQNHHQQAQPNLLHHPLAMTSLSSCPTRVDGSFSRTGTVDDAMNGAVASGNGNPYESSSSSNASQNGKANHECNRRGSHGVTSSLPQASIVSRSSMSNATSCQNRRSPSNNNSSSSRTINDSIRHPFLPSWNDSMGDLMYSSLFNIGIPNTTTNNLDGTTINPYQFTPLNSAFGAIPTNNNSMSINHHYGMAINGFHPQVNASVNPVLPLTNMMPAPGIPSTGATGYGSRAGTASPGTVKTSNAGKSTSGSAAPLSMYNQQSPSLQSSSSQPQPQQSFPQPTWLYSSQKQQQQQLTKAAKERNEREQIRAKKITQLIDELRVNMQKEGWKEEMKSKYETLSQ